MICPHSSRDANESRGKTNYSVAQSCDLLLHTISDQARSATLNALFHLIHIKLLSFSEFVNLNVRLGRSDVNCTHRLPFINNYLPNLAKCEPGILLPRNVRSGGRAVERRTVNRGDGGSIPPTAVSKLRQFLHPTFACVFRKRH